jgi:hypothetical protein
MQIQGVYRGRMHEARWQSGVSRGVRVMTDHVHNCGTFDDSSRLYREVSRFKMLNYMPSRMSRKNQLHITTELHAFTCSYKRHPVEIGSPAFERSQKRRLGHSWDYR